MRPLTALALLLLDLTLGAACGGSGGTPAGQSRAVVWTAREVGFAVEVLPLPPGAEICGHAAAISGARIAGACRAANGAALPTVWTIDSDDGARHAVAWIERDGVFAPGELPAPDGALRCERATAVSGPYVAGACVYARSRGEAIVWRRTGDTTWTVHAQLRPLDGEEESTVVGVAGTLAAGASILDQRWTPVAWRIASAAGS